MREYEAPLRKTTAQVDTDVLRQTLLGDMQSYDDQGRRIIGYEKGERGEVDPAELSAWEAETARLEEAVPTGFDDLFDDSGAAAARRTAAIKALEEHKATRPQPRGVVDPAELAEWEAELEKMEDDHRNAKAMIEASEPGSTWTNEGESLARIEEHKANRPPANGRKINPPSTPTLTKARSARNTTVAAWLTS